MTDYKIIFGPAIIQNKLVREILLENLLKKILIRKKIKINTLKLDDYLNHKYIAPYIGIISCWKHYFKGYSVGYINFLPLWNFLIFFLLPPRTILGPITGGALYNKSNVINYLIRKIVFPFFYKFSELILIIRFKKKLIFSTELLKQYLSKKIIRKSSFNFVLKNLIFKKKKKIKILTF